jgi:uncharacterized protein YndB with AHSA1/START domain
MKRDIKLEAFYPHARERVWKAFASSDALGKWLMPNDFEPRIGHEFRFTTKPAPGFDGIVHCKVLEIKEPETLAFTWKGGPVDTVVRFSLESVPNGTLLRLEQSGFAGLQAYMVSFLLGGGWKKMLRKALPTVLDDIGDLGSSSEAKHSS